MIRRPRRSPLFPYTTLSRSQIAKREQQIRTAGRMTATSWFNTAVSYYNLSRKAEAREYAEKVSDDEQVVVARSEEHTSELQSQSNLVCRLLLEKKKKAL